MVLFHYPDTWLELAAWHAGGGGAGPAAALAVLEKGRGALPEALALHFAAADLQVGGWVCRVGGRGAACLPAWLLLPLLEGWVCTASCRCRCPDHSRCRLLRRCPQESQGNVAAARAIYEQLVERLRPEEAAASGAASAGALAGSGGSTVAAAAAAGDGVQQPAAAAPAVKQEGAEDGQQPAGGDGGSPAAPAAEQQPKDEAAAGAAAPEQAPAALQQEQAQQGQQEAAAGVALGPEQGTLAWIQYMRFLRRTEGIMAARKVGGVGVEWGGECVCISACT